MEIVRRACDPDPGARYPCFEAMEDALRRASASGRPPVPGASDAPRPAPPPGGALLGRIAGWLRGRKGRGDASAAPEPSFAAGNGTTRPPSFIITDPDDTVTGPPSPDGTVGPAYFDADPVATSMAAPFMGSSDRSGASPACFDADPVATSMVRPRRGSGPSGPGFAAGGAGGFAPNYFDDDLNATTLPLSAAAKVPAAKAPTLKTERVEFTAVAPKTFARGEYAMVDIVMYEATCRYMVDELMRQSDEPVREKRGGVAEVTRQDQVRIVLSAPDVQIEDDAQTMSWQGGYLDFSFAVLLPEDYSRQQLVFTARVYANDVPRMRLMFTAKVDSTQAQRLEVFRRQVMSAFVSYASQDRRRVAAMIQGMQKICPELDIFFDVNSLHSGEYWEQTLRREIDRRDVLFLCWSRNASKSEWVEKEWRYALERKGLDGIEPLPIEPTDVCPPPPELGSMHFNDMILYVIGPNGWEGTRQGG